MSDLHLQLLADLDSEDISSASSEIKRKKAHKKAQTAKIVTPKPSVKLTPPIDLSAFLQTANTTNVPAIGSFEELLKDYPHLMNTSIPPSKGKAQKEPKIRSSATDTQFATITTNLKEVENTVGGKHNSSLKHQIQADSKPVDIELYEKKLAKVTEASYYHTDLHVGKLTKQQFSEALRRKQLFLPISLAAHESELLKEGGRFKHIGGRVYDFPLCLNGKDCVGMTSPFPNKPRGFIFMCFMYQEAYERFLATDEAPPRCACVACIRTAHADFITFNRALRNQPDCDTAFEATHDTDVAHQLFANLVDGPGGYRRERMLQTQAGDPMIEPIARMQCSYTSVEVDVYDPKRLVLNQTALLWHPNPVLQPRLGESTSDF